MKVELISHFGSDEMVVDCARVSYSKTAKKYTKEQNEGLIKFLLKHNHWSPFSHPRLQFRITCPIYVERQLVKTEAGREYNSISGRYVDFSDTYTKIKKWREKPSNSKQGSGKNLDNELQITCSKIENEIIKQCKLAYDELLSLGVCKEQARTVLPLNLNTTMVYTCSLWTFIRLYKQRTKSDAQKEIAELLEIMLKEVISKTGDDFTISLDELRNK